MPARRRGRFVVWMYGFSQDLKVWGKVTHLYIIWTNSHNNNLKTNKLMAKKSAISGEYLIQVEDSGRLLFGEFLIM